MVWDKCKGSNYNNVMSMSVCVFGCVSVKMCMNVYDNRMQH